MPFLIGICAGWLVTTVLLVLNVAEPWAIGSGWLTFIAVTTLLHRFHYPPHHPAR